MNKQKNEGSLIRPFPLIDQEIAQTVDGVGVILFDSRIESDTAMNFIVSQAWKLKTADEITEMLALGIIDDPAYTRVVREWDFDKEEWVDVKLVDPPLKKGDQVLAFVNSMGGTPAIELPILYRKLHEICEKKGLKIVRAIMGPIITSLEMQGCSITLLKMDDELIELWDYPVKTIGMRWGM